MSNRSTINIPSTLHAALREHADRDSRTVTAAASMAVTTYLARERGNRFPLERAEIARRLVSGGTRSAVDIARRIFEEAPQFVAAALATCDTPRFTWERRVLAGQVSFACGESTVRQGGDVWHWEASNGGPFVTLSGTCRDVRTAQRMAEFAMGLMADTEKEG